MLKEAQRIKAASRAVFDADIARDPRGTDEGRKRFREDHDRGMDLERQAKAMLHPVRKLRATTPAGVVAKAPIVRSSVTGAAE